MTARRIRTPLFLALGLVALTACKTQTIEIRPPDPVVAVPRPEDPGVVTLASALPQRLIAADKATEVRVRLRIDASKRPPINVVLVMDSSGSMEGKAIEDARAAAVALVDGLAEGDRLAVVSFDSTPHVLVPSTRIDAKTQDTIRAQIVTMTARGTTDLAAGLSAGLSAGLAAGLAEAGRGYLNDGVNRPVLLSDGVPNDESPMTALAQQAASMRVSVTALGLGLEYNETLLSSLTQNTGGKFHLVEDSTQVATVFRQEVLRLERVVAQNVQFTLLAGPGVTVEGVLCHSTTPVGSHRTSLCSSRPRRAPSPRRALPPSCWATANSSSWPTASSNSAKPSRPSCCNPSRSPPPAPAFRRARSQRPRWR